MAGMEPYQHVSGRRTVLSAGGPSGGNGAQAAGAGAAAGGGGDHHHGGAGGGAGGESGLCRVGLPRPARKLLRSDLPPVLVSVDRRCLGRREAVPRPQRKAGSGKIVIWRAIEFPVIANQ